MTTAPAAKKAAPTAAPAAPRKTAAAGKVTGHPGGAQATGLMKHLETLGETDVMSPEGLYEYCEAYRQLMVGVAFFVHAAVAQMERAVRMGTKGIVDGRLTLRQKAEFITVLRRMKRRMDDGMGELLLDGAANSVKVYGMLQEFLDNLESDTVSRPHNKQAGRGGFSFGGGK